MLLAWLVLALALFARGQEPAASPERAHELQREARAALAQGDPARARALAREGLELLKALGPPPAGEEGWSAAQALGRLGSDLTGAGDTELGLEALETSLAWCEANRPADDLWVLQTRGNLAHVLKGLGRLAAARAIEEEVLAAFERSLAPKAPERVMARVNLAQTCGRQRDYEEAGRLLEEAHELASALGEGGVLLLETIEMNLADVRRERGARADALRLMAGVVRRREARLPPEHPALLLARKNLAILLGNEGRHAEARAVAEELLEVYQRLYPPGHESVLSMREDLARCALELGDLSSALALFEEAARLRELAASEDPRPLEEVQLGLAGALRIAGDVERARRLIEPVLAARELRLPPGHRDLGWPSAALALCRRASGDLEGAFALERRVLEQREARLQEDDLVLLRSRASFAGTLAELGRLEEALALRERTLEIAERVLEPDDLVRFNLRHDLANNLYRLERREEALARYEELVETAERLLPAEHVWRFNARLNQATIQTRVGRLAEALENLRALGEELDLLFPPGDERRSGLRHNLALSLAQAGRLEEARAEALRLADEIEAGLADSAFLAPREARAAARAERARLSLVLSLCDEGDPARRAFELAESVRRVALAPPPALEGERAAELAAELSGLRARLGERPAREGLPDETPDEDGELAALALRRDRLERELRLLAAEGGLRFEPVRLEELVAGLPESSLLVCYLEIPLQAPGDEPGSWEVEERLVAHALRGDMRLARADLGPAAELSALVSRWREAVGSPLGARGLALAGGEARELGDGEEALALGRELRRRLLDPLLEEAGLARELLVVADSLVFPVPLDALPLDELEDGTEAYVGDRVSLVQLPALLARRAAPPAAAARLVAVGGVDYARAEGSDPRLSSAAFAPPLALARSGGTSFLDALPGTAAELEALASSARARGLEVLELTGVGATKSALAAAVGGARFVHLATHGWFLDPGPGRAEMASFAPLLLCGLALAGANRGLAGERDLFGRVPGLLTAEELCSLELSACELAVLSACETNVGIAQAGRGIQSLQAALHAAGASSALTSLWRVDDEATRELMERFYRHFWQDELPAAEALWRAKRALADAGRPPREWAGWVLCNRSTNRAWHFRANLRRSFPWNDASRCGAGWPGVTAWG